MVAADGLNDLETNVKRAALLQKWEKRIREQVAIKRNKNTTKTQIGKIADEEAMELRHQGVVEDNQNDPDIVENQASAACDYSYIVYDEVMNIRFTAHEMWNLISDQRIVPEDTDPFFIIHFNWKDGEFNNIRWLDWNGNSRKGEYEPVPSVPPRFSERLQQLYRDKLGQSLKYWEEKQKPFLKKRKTLGFEDYEDLENDSFSRSTMDQFIDQSDYDQDNLGRLYDLLIEAPQTDIDSHQSLTSINVVDQNFTGFSGTQMRTLALRLFPGSGIREDEDWGDKDNDDEEDEEYEISEESEEGDGDYDDGGEEGDEIEEVKKIEEEVDDENAYKIFGDSVDIDLDWKIDVDLNILDDLYERYQAAWRESLPDKDPRKRRLKKKPNKKMEIETVGLEEENEDDDLGEEESVMEFEESKVNLNHGSARLDDESKAPAVLMEAIEEEAETAVQFIDPTIFRTSFNGEVPASIADLLFSAITYKPEPKPKKKRRTKAKEDRNIDDKKPRPGRRPRHTAEKTTKNPQKKGSKDKTGEAKNNTETVQKRSSKKIHKEGNGSDQLRRRRGRSTTKDTNASGLQKKLEYKKAAGAIVTGEKGTTKEIKGEDEGEKGPEKRTKRN
ncbi:hypothetical protein NW762_014838 [Fusarium torreyae]|uniref:Uncharacterized protein n=1 Tax=Fusarium torreyae TaxID=1237075 RepID=A0A9W8RL08_9HYPO|nr:hypothetical protein NW762_014838 [Fusarium torreyae]